MIYKFPTMPAYSSLISEYEPDKSSTFGLLVYGPSGCGKTTLAASFPEPFFIDADRGMRSLGKIYPRVQLQDTETPFALIMSILTDALAGRGEWAPTGKLGKIRTIVIDSVTSLIDDYLGVETMNEAKRNVLMEKLSYDEYGKIQSRMTALSSVIKDLTHKYWVVMTALVEEEKDESSGKLTGKPKLTGKYRDKIMADFDETYYMECQTQISGPPKFITYPRPYLWYRAKTRLLKPSVTAIVDATYDKIVANFK